MMTSNKLAVGRIILSIIILILLSFPWAQINVNFPTIAFDGKVDLNTKYLLCAILATIRSLTDYFYGSIARQSNKVSNSGNIMDPIADKILFNGILIILAIENRIHRLVPVILFIRDIMVDAIRVAALNKNSVVFASKLSKWKTSCLMISVKLLLLNDLPFSLYSIHLGEPLASVGVALSVLSGLQYFSEHKNDITKDI